MPVALPDPLLQAVKSRKCILFVGSGLSSMAGYLTWGDLIKVLIAAAKDRPFAPTKGIMQYEEEKDYLTLAEFARSVLTANEYQTILTQQIGRQLNPTAAHRAIARTDYRGLITTNYDRLLETTFTQIRNAAPNSFTPEAIASLATALFDPAPFIFKLHGDIGAAESIVLTTQDYDRLSLQSPHVRAFLQAVFLSHRLLFIGYSVRDPDFQLILRELTLIFGSYTPTHYALIAGADEFTSEQLKRRMNIQAIPYSRRNNHREVVQILRQIQAAVPYQAG